MNWNVWRSTLNRDWLIIGNRVWSRWSAATGRLGNLHWGIFFADVGGLEAIYGDVVLPVANLNIEVLA